jgi:hypothetical protein
VVTDDQDREAREQAHYGVADQLRPKVGRPDLGAERSQGRHDQTRALKGLTRLPTLRLRRGVLPRRQPLTHDSAMETFFVRQNSSTP